MKEVIEFILELKNKDLYVKELDGYLKITGNINSITEHDKERIIYLKKGILNFLRQKRANEKGFEYIKANAENKYYPLSSSQKRLWIISQFDEGSSAYNIKGAFFFKGKLNIAALEDSFIKLLDRHEILRTSFKYDKMGEIKQLIARSEEVGFTINYQDLRKEENMDELLKSLIQSSFCQPFALSVSPLLRANLYAIEDEKWVFSYVMHHIISDGWSMNVMIKELFILYNAYLNREVNPLPPLRIQFKDYAIWQQEQLNEKTIEIHKQYWLKQFDGDLSVLNLPLAKPRPIVKTFNGASIEKNISLKLSKDLKTLSEKEGATFFTSLLTLVKLLLHRHSTQEDICVGTPTAGREHIDLEKQIGFYVNTLALRTQFKSNNSFIELLKTVKQVALEAFEHQIYPFEMLVDALNLKRDLSRNPLFDVTVELIDMEATMISGLQKFAGDLEIEKYDDEGDFTSKFDLSFQFAETDKGLHLTLIYNTDIYEKRIAERLTDHLVSLLELIIEYPNQSINSLDFLCAEEKYMQLTIFNTTKKEYSKNGTIIDLFEEQVKNTPHTIALVFEEKVYTYQQLNNHSNQLGCYLRANYDIKANDLVGVKLDRSDRMIVAILGILKSGAAYVPMDPSYPKARIDYIINDSKCKVVFDEKEFEKFRTNQAEYATVNPEIIHTPQDLSYIIYTSGSTGSPKGVMIEHRNVNAFINWCKDEFRNSDFDTVLGLTSICFDLSIFEIFYTLCSGKKLRLVTDVLSILDVVNNANEKFLLNTVPSVVYTLIKEKIDFANISVLNMAGEPISSNITNHLNYDKIEVRNLYGPSEDTTYSTVFRIREKSVVCIGRPITNTGVYILADARFLLPIGVPGEVCIDGNGLARGYLNNPALTAEKFISHPFKPGERLYRTGDLGYWLTDGNIAFVGRKDDQVKLRGYRVELGEIENTLLQFQSVSEALVLVSGHSAEDKNIVAYIVQKKPFSIDDLKSYLRTKLPAYMIPAHFVKLTQFPLLANGKIDKKKLPAVEKQILKSLSNEPGPNLLEEKLLQIWKNVLATDHIELNDNFFELGGNSIKAIQIIYRVKREMNVKLSLGYLFQNSSIRDFIKNMYIDVTPENKGIIPLNKKTDGNPTMFFFPMSWGDTAIFYEMAFVIGKEYNSYQLKLKGLHEDLKFETTLEELAGNLLKQILDTTTKGPYILVGYSWAVPVVYEVVKQMEKTTIERIVVILIDCEPNFKGVQSENSLSNYENINLEVINNYLPEVNEKELERLRKFWVNNNSLFNNYLISGVIRSEIYCFQAQSADIEKKFPIMDMCKWNKYTCGNFENFIIKGTHFTMVEKPVKYELSILLKQVLDKNLIRKYNHCDMEAIA